MKKFNLFAKVTVSVYTEVEAETLEEAIEKADDRHLASIVPVGGDTEKDAWICHELDGTPYDIKED